MDYSTLEFETCDDESMYSFVGIYRVINENGESKLKFRLPLGFPNPEKASYDTGRDLHITFFKLFNRFRKIASGKQAIKNPHEDAGPNRKGGREWITHHDEGDVYYYRHFDAFDTLLEAFDELRILALERRLRLSEGSPTDLRNFQRSDAGRIYHVDGSFFDDVSLQERPTVTLSSSDLVGLYCFLLRDLREHVWGRADPHPLQEDILVLAENFRDKHLDPGDSCWEEESWKRTRDALRDKLEVIDRVTALKDDDYHSLYAAVERFLYPSDDDPHGNGNLWGIEGFWPVWEWLALTRLATVPEFRDRLLWIDAGNLEKETIDDLMGNGFTHPRDTMKKKVDTRVLCRVGSCWETFLENGKKLGHPYPDAILTQADWSEKDISKGNEWYLIGKLILEEGPIKVTVEINDNDKAPVLARSRKKTPDECLIAKKSYNINPAPYEGTLDVILKVNDMVHEQCLNQPAIIGALRRLGEWNVKDSGFWMFKPFESMACAERKHMHGALLIDVKYKKPSKNSEKWAKDHRKQSSYEDLLTLSNNEMPGAYSVYICPDAYIGNKQIKVFENELNDLIKAEKNLKNNSKKIGIS